MISRWSASLLRMLQIFICISFNARISNKTDHLIQLIKIKTRGVPRLSKFNLDPKLLRRKKAECFNTVFLQPLINNVIFNPIFSFLVSLLSLVPFISYALCKNAPFLIIFQLFWIIWCKIQLKLFLFPFWSTFLLYLHLFFFFTFNLTTSL